MNKKTTQVQINMPEFLTIGQYMTLIAKKTEGKVEQMVTTISTLLEMDRDEVLKMDLKAIADISTDLLDIAQPKEMFYPVIEWHGKLWGYTAIQHQSLGEYIDIENHSQDLEKGLHKLMAVMYRPIEEHSLGSISYKIKNGIKVISQKGVEDPFKRYTLEKYDSRRTNSRHDLFRDFPVHIALGALGFFLHNAVQYSIDIQSSPDLPMVQMMKKEMTEALTDSIGGGSALYTISARPTSSRLQEIKPSQTSTF
jgi:hypothetical protein